MNNQSDDISTLGQRINVEDVPIGETVMLISSADKGAGEYHVYATTNTRVAPRQLLWGPPEPSLVNYDCSSFDTIRGVSESEVGQVKTQLLLSYMRSKKARYVGFDRPPFPEIIFKVNGVA